MLLFILSKVNTFTWLIFSIFQDFVFDDVKGFFFLNQESYKNILS
jgi:hypothetical protein